MRSRMDDLGRDLSEALERAERESRRNRFLSDLGTSIEFDELLDRVLDAALEVPGFDAAMVSLDEHGGGTATTATRGMTPEEAAHPPSSGAGGVLPAGPITVSYRYGAADAADTHLIRGGLFLALVGREGHQLGSLALFWRTPGYEPSPERIGTVEQIAETCIPALENARRYREAQAARGDRRAHRVLQPALLPRDAPTGGAPRAALRPAAGAADPRPRRLQGGQRQGRPPRRRRRARPGRRAAPQRDPVGGHRLPRGRGRVRGRDARVDGGGRVAALRPHARRGLGDADAGRPARCGSRPASPSCGTARRRPACSSGPTAALRRSKDAGKNRATSASE